MWETGVLTRENSTLKKVEMSQPITCLRMLFGSQGVLYIIICYTIPYYILKYEKVQVAYSHPLSHSCGGLEGPLTEMALTPLFFNKFAIFLKILNPQTHIYLYDILN